MFYEAEMEDFGEKKRKVVSESAISGDNGERETIGTGTMVFMLSPNGNVLYSEVLGDACCWK